MIPLVLCFFAPFAFDQYTLPKIALAAVCVYAAGLERGFTAKTLTTPLMFMLFAVCVSGLFSGDPSVNLFGRYMSRYLGIVPLAVCWWAYHLRPQQRLDAQMRWAGGLLAVYGLSQLVWSPLGYDVISSGGRVAGMMGSPPALGCALAMCLPFCLGKRWLTALVAAGLVATGSRGPMLAAAIAGVIVCWDRITLRGRWWAALPAIAACAIYFNHGASDAIRLLTWKTALQVWWAHPLVGCGAESYVDAWRAFRSAEWVALVGPATYQDHAHNDVLMVLASFGVLGLAAYGYLLWETWKLTQARLGARQILASLVAVFICAKFNAVPFAVLFVLALLLGSLDGWGVSSRSRWTPVLSTAALVSVTVFGFAVDTVFYKTRRVLDFEGVTAAAKMNPTELFYQAHMADLLTRKFLATGEFALLERALDISLRAHADHPSSVQARHMTTQTLVMMAQAAGDHDSMWRAQVAAEDLFAHDPQANFRFKIVVK